MMHILDGGYMKKISVIIPMYKVEEYLEECLNSIVNQTLEDIEIICVDDGSPDRSGDIALEWAKKHKNIKVIRKENGGLSSARNAGIEQSTGKYLYFIDSDDYLDLNALEELYLKAEEEQLDILYFNTVPFFENEEVKNANKGYINFYNRTGDYSSVCTGTEMFVKMRKNREFFGSACLQLLRKSLLEDNQIRFYNGILHEDNLFSFQCVMQAKRVGYIDKAFYYRRVHGDSIMTVKKTMRNVEGYIISYAEILSFIRECDFEENAKPVITDYLYNSMYRNGYNIFGKLDKEEQEKSFSNGDFVAAFLLEKIKKDSKIETDLKTKIASLEKKLDDEKKKTKQALEKCEKLRKEYSNKSLKSRIKNKVKKIKNRVKKAIKSIKEKGFLYTCRLAYVKVIRKTGGLRPLVSIVMPVYNVEPFIEQGMESLLKQTMKHIEIIAVDDGSTDRTLEILKKYEANDKRVHVYSQKNKYAGVARNLGLSKAKGEYIVFLDSDDFFSKDLAKDAYSIAKLHKADIVLFGAKHYNNATGKYADAKWLLNAKLAPKKQPFSYKDCPNELYSITTPCPWTKMFRRKFILKAGLQYQGLQNSNDLFFTYSALAMAKKIVTLDKVLVNYRVGLTNNIQSGKTKNPLCFYEAYKAWHDKLIELGVMNELKQSYVNVALSGCMYNLNSIKDLDAKKIVFEKLKNEIFEELEVLNYDESYYYSKKNYADMILIQTVDFQEYLKKQ